MTSLERYYTPIECAAAVVARIRRDSRTKWTEAADLCAGTGVFGFQIREQCGTIVTESDLAPGAAHVQKADFAEFAARLPPRSFSHMITNPPNAKILEIVDHGLRLCAEVHLLIPANFVSSISGGRLSFFRRCAPLLITPVHPRPSFHGPDSHHAQKKTGQRDYVLASWLAESCASNETYIALRDPILWIP